jgi:hypothetical protein
MLKMWETSPWGEEVIAQLVEREQIQGFLKQALIGPGEACVLIRNGKLEDVLTQDKIKGLSGGITNWLANRLGGGESLQLLYVSTAPIDLQFAISGILSKDHEEVSGTCTMRIQANQNDAPKIINLMKGLQEVVQTKKGLFRTQQISLGRILLRSAVEQKLEKEAISMVFATHISNVDAKDFRGNLNLIKEMETSAEMEMRKTFEMWGLDLLKLYTVWNRGAYDELQRWKREREQVYERTEFESDLATRQQLSNLNNAYQIRKTEQEQRWALGFGEAQGAERIKAMTFEAELGRTQKSFDEQLRQRRAAGMTEVDLKREDMHVGLEKDKGEMDIAMDAFAKVQEAKRQRIAMEQTHQQKQMEMQTGAQERIMAQALQTGAADSVALQEMMRQQTMQKMADRDTEKVKALSEAERARYDKETFMQAEDRERRHNVDTMGQTARIMEASKQNNPNYVGGGIGYGAQPAVNVVTVEHGAGKGPAEPAHPGGMKCPNCGEDVKPAWKSCPGCGQEMPKQAAGSKCTNCGEEVKPGWKQCPGCGAKLGVQKMVCGNCGEEIKPNWKKCPACGFPQKT